MISIGWLVIAALVCFWLGQKTGVAWDRYWCDREDYAKLKANSEAQYRLAQGALRALVDWQERAQRAEEKLRQVEEFEEYIDG